MLWGVSICPLMASISILESPPVSTSDEQDFELQEGHHVKPLLQQLKFSWNQDFLPLQEEGVLGVNVLHSQYLLLANQIKVLCDELC